MKQKNSKTWIVVSLLLIPLAACENGIQAQLEEHSRQALEAEHAGLLQLRESLAQLATEAPAARIFISTSIIDALLGGLDGQRLHLESTPPLAIEIESMRTRFSHGFPALDIRCWAEVPGTDLRLRLSILAVLAVRLIDDEAPSAVLEPRILDVVPVLEWKSSAIDLRSFAERLLAAKLQEQLDKLSQWTLPIASDLDLTLPASEHPMPFEAGRGRIEGKLSVPELKLSRRVVLQQVLFLEDGLHLFMGLEG